MSGENKNPSVTKFGGWKVISPEGFELTEAQKNTEKTMTFTMPASPVELKASYSFPAPVVDMPVIVTGGTIRVGGGESQTGTVLVQPGQTVTIEANEPVKENESFHHWKVEKDSSKNIGIIEGSLGSETEKGTEKIVFTIPQDGVKLTVRWLTYPSRQELPLLAESAQASLKEIGIDVDINCTANRREFLADMGSWDIYASALVTAPSGDPQYFFTTSCVPGMSYNFGAYDNPEVTALIEQLSREFDPAKRGEMAVTLQQMILDDNAYVFCSFLQMNMISKENVKNYTAHACDYYQVTVDLDIT